MGNKLYVGNLSFSINDAALSDLFAQAGTVTSAKVIIENHTGRSKGFGFVEMSTDDEASEAIKKFDGYEFEGRKLKVAEARPKEPRRDSFDRGGSGPGRFGKKKRW